ncbi:2-dehydro-3-deoxy-6-phosphogalactonate aldolase [uncultured Cocleimonas sp.]|uniref:2-dehydro-3-deoxy-6-phosphogalactonate aldolase n=1 Tax=uncultured Cocleimonas sp. TaxID=1051587 RepID=UPI00262709C3|nr:2-dehydro-3-deoxy-6-phosphogalactonate aldolase [uncultured Cocleimonas sp.]
MSPRPSRKLIAILRGITPDEAESVSEMLVEKGFDWIEVPLNSPNAFDSIERMAKHLGERAHIGAGTVLNEDDIIRIKEAGGTFIVSPNFDIDVVQQTKKLNMGSYPGVLTPSECFAALKAGADALKLFPATAIGGVNIQAMRAVLPEATDLYAVGGCNPENLGEWLSYGVDGFGIGSALYKPGKSVAEIAKSAEAFVEAFDKHVSA